jgi:hypothetical protein
MTERMIILRTEDTAATITIQKIEDMAIEEVTLEETDLHLPQLNCVVTS